MRFMGCLNFQDLNYAVILRRGTRYFATGIMKQNKAQSPNGNDGPTIEEHSRRVKNVIPSSYERAIRFLQSSVHNIGHQSIIFQSRPGEMTKSIPVNSEVFSAALIYDVIKQLPGLEIPDCILQFIDCHMSESGLFQYFSNRPHNDDVDTTSVCTYALLQGNKLNLRLAKSIARCVSFNCIFDSAYTSESSNRQNRRRIIKVFFPPDVPLSASATALDEGTMANSLRLLYFLGMENTAVDTEDHLFDWIRDSKRFHEGSLYYSPDVILYFLSNCNLLSKHFYSRFQDILTLRLEERLGTTDTPLDLSMRINTAHNLGLLGNPRTVFTSTSPVTEFQYMNHDISKSSRKLTNMLEKEADLLSRKQKLDGSWEADPIFRFYSIFFTNRTATTAFGAKALLALNKTEV